MFTFTFIQIEYITRRSAKHVMPNNVSYIKCKLYSSDATLIDALHYQ